MTSYDPLPTINQLLAQRALPGVDVLKQPITIPQIPSSFVIATNDSARLAHSSAVSWLQLDQLRAFQERGHHRGYDDYLASVGADGPPSPAALSHPFNPVQVLFSYDKPSRPHTVDDFVSYFNQRYRLIRSMLHVRPELAGALSINHLLKKRAREHASTIGIVTEKAVSPRGHLFLTIEDPTGQIRVLISKNKPDLFAAAQDVMLDEVIGVVGVAGDRIIFAQSILWPDIPYNQELKKAPDEVYALFLSDIHVGSRYFLSDAFQHFLRWIRGMSGTEEQRDLAQKVRYVFIAGDLVDGVGIYPNQDKELIIQDIYEQYREFARLLAQIPPHIHIVLCPGNHDALRLSEPQPRLDQDFAAPLHQLPNVTLVSNPALLRIHASEHFPGFDILLYHGYSFDYYVATADSLRNSGGYHRADLIMRFLLKRRHLAPSHTSTLYIPDHETDPLVISHVPDIFATGHIHYSLVAQHRHITLISGSCWQSMTSFQEKMGHDPEPARVPAINLKTRAAKILRFG